MVRCLSNAKNDEYDLTMDAAKDYGLIFHEDVFINNPDDNIKPDTFYILLGRLLRQKRYKYYGRENNVFLMKGLVDADRSITYQEMLEQRQAERGVDKTIQCTSNGAVRDR